MALIGLGTVTLLTLILVYRGRTYLEKAMLLVPWAVYAAYAWAIVP